ncbi:MULTISPECIES: DUF6188 family protein [Thermocrispum]|jgi:hypothetical protein|uniref:DUF6188 family protein n=1 Tax=Thermocrispum agreste TaxID=37925 RepID=A0A2W4JHF5_9PSEU|nr:MULTISPECIES: DUF6188 family protein [Thermocrispum]PZM98480.1 MAG: hypothetical protein DIU77_07880 [Thermocrispum agreste]
MDLGVAGQFIAEATGEFALVVRTDGGVEVRVESDFTVSGNRGTVTYSPDTITDSTVFNWLVGKRIIAAVVDDAGALTMTLADGTKISVPPDEEFEAWTLAGPGARKIVSMPGGELTVFSGDK